jgi:SAM-dependent methyltransferase
MTATSQAAGASGSAERWGPLWGARPGDWALSEDQQRPTYEEALRRVDLKPGQLVLDIGCGVGAFLRLISDRGARVFGLDASEALLELARQRVADADLRVGDMEALPYQDHTFDLVTGFNSFFFANDIVAALREAGRVAKPSAPIVIQVWGPHERNDLEAMKEIIRPFCRRDPPTRHPSSTTPSPACSKSSPPKPALSPRTRSTPPGPTNTPTRTRSAERWWRPPGSPCSSAPHTSRRSRTPSSPDWQRAAPRTAATGSTTNSTT